MATITCNNDQLQLIQNALELYSRIGILQIDKILNHPSVHELIDKQFRPTKTKLEVGDQTERGEIVKITKKSISTKGSWGNGEEIKVWKDIDKIKLAQNWEEYHKHTHLIEEKINELEALISGSNEFIRYPGMSFGIHRTEDLGKTNLQAYDIIQVIRHEFWKARPKDAHSFSTVDSHVNNWTGNPVTVEIDKPNK